MKQMTIYLVLTTKLAIANFHKRGEGGIPMLNDNLGDQCHHDPADAVAAGLHIADSLEGERDVTIVHILYPESLHQELVSAGEIEPGSARDFRQRPLYKMSKEAARRLNAEARFLTDVYPLPLEVPPVQSGSSTTVH